MGAEAKPGLKRNDVSCRRRRGAIASVMTSAYRAWHAGRHVDGGAAREGVVHALRLGEPERI